MIQCRAANLEALLPQQGPDILPEDNLFDFLEADYVPSEIRDLSTQPWKPVMPVSVLLWAIVVES